MPHEKIKKKDLGKFEQRVWPGIFLGYVLQPGGHWEGAYEVAPLSDFRAADITEADDKDCLIMPGRKGMNVRRLRIREVYTKKDAKHVLPLAASRREAMTKFKFDTNLVPHGCC